MGDRRKAILTLGGWGRLSAILLLAVFVLAALHAALPHPTSISRCSLCLILHTPLVAAGSPIHLSPSDKPELLANAREVFRPSSTTQAPKESRAPPSLQKV